MRESILFPRSIAIVGVSQDKKKIGTVIYNNVLEGEFNGKLYPVNPKYKDIEGEKCYPDILAIDSQVDTVCIVIPSQFVESVVDQCIQKKVKSVIVISSGFKETGKEGAELENRIANKLKTAGIRLIGPNTLGFINNSIDLNLSFARENPGNGSIAFISQSGAFCTAILDMAIRDSIGFSKVISIGNKADIFENELVEYLESDKETNAIAIYLEEFEDGKDFIDIAKNSTKPMIIIAPGSSQKAKEAISSHTGSLATSYDTTLAAIAKSNLIKVESSEELFDTIKVISGGKLPKGKGVAIITNAGGPGIMATDYTEQFGLHLAEIGEKTKEKLSNFLPIQSNINNPVDILGDALLDRYEYTINTILEDTLVHSLIVILTPQLITDIVGVAKAIVEIQKRSPKPIFPCFLGGNDVEEGNKILRAYGMYVSNNLEDTLKLVSKLTKYKLAKDTNQIQKISNLMLSGNFKTAINERISDEIQVLDDEIVEGILKESDIELPHQLISASMKETVDFASKHFPVVIKATSKTLEHKTDFEAIFLDIRTISELQEKFEELSNNIKKVTGKNAADILVQEMIEPRVEFFIGANREGEVRIYEEDGLGFGHLLAIGQGGIYTEIYKDIKHILVPESTREIEKKLNQTRIVKIIDGYRGKPKLPKEKLIETINKVQKILVTYPEIYSLDMNPIIVTEDRVVAVDVKMYIKK